jgi:quercetin 2,3-dioxygenase
MECVCACVCAGDLRAGDVQWMTAGAGIIHDEAPSQGMMDKGGTMEGFQLWVNLPKAEKMCRPDYQGTCRLLSSLSVTHCADRRRKRADVASSKIPEFKSDSFTVRVIAGEAFGLEKAAVHTRMPVQYLDFHCRKDARFTHTLPKCAPPHRLTIVFTGAE